MTNSKTVSVAIPTYNRSSYLSESIQSVLSQTWQDFNIIVIDNASVDDTSEVVSQFEDSRISYYKNQFNIGIIGNWNKAINLCESDFIVIFGDDDKMRPNFLGKSVAVFEKYPNIGFSFCHYNKIDHNGEFIRL